ncbi:hypothetical protein FXO38_31265 [Capsicum annuum]|nr:hypothetical protein FXO38_31265 [Capsicum annuum]
MKNVAKYDTWCELQNPMNHRVFKSKLRPKPLVRGHVCLGITHRVFPLHRASITGRAVMAGRILASRMPRARGWPKCMSMSTDVAEVVVVTQVSLLSRLQPIVRLESGTIPCLGTPTATPDQEGLPGQFKTINKRRKINLQGFPQKRQANQE